MNYPKRLIEIDLPIARISAHARREKSIRHGHISTLHIWWARRPLAACRAVICAALWPDPADPNCPRAFLEAAATHLTAFAKRVNPEMITEEKHRLQATVSHESRGRWEALAAGTLTLDIDDPSTGFMLQLCLLDFIADFANWDSSTVPAYMETSRALTQAAHEALGGTPGTRPLVVDPFAGGGSIPLEALRVGADAFASDLNPVAVLLNKIMLEYVPKYCNADISMKDADGNERDFHGLAEAVRYWGNWVKAKAENDLIRFYPKDPDGSTPIAYLWARTILSEAPGQGDIPVEVPLVRSLWLCKKPNRKVALRWVRDTDGLVKTETMDVTYADGVIRTVRRPLLEIFEPNRDSEVEGGTVARGSATCPVTGYTTRVASVRNQMKRRFGGAADSRLFAVVTTRDDVQGRYFRLPTPDDLARADEAAALAKRQSDAVVRGIPEIPDEPTPMGGGRGAGRAFSQRNYGMDTFRDLFAPRQRLLLATLASYARQLELVASSASPLGVTDAIQAFLACGVDRVAEHATSLCRWNASGPKMQATFGRQALPMMWDFCEASPLGGSVGSWENILECLLVPLAVTDGIHTVGVAAQSNAASHPMPNESASAFITDPPYYDAVPYSDLSDFFYVWQRRTAPPALSHLFEASLTPKANECIVDEVKGLDASAFETCMRKSMSEGRRVLQPSGIGLVVFAHKSTAGWESQLQAMIDGGWIMTASWPIDTEMATRLRAMDSAALASSVHLVCRPRENADGKLTESVGEWRDVLGELPKRIHEWMPRLAAEGVVGADAIFACLGPALEIFSRYSQVEKANGEPATLSEYLEFVWAAVSTEALALIFKDADASGLEPDARLTAMWLWTIGGGTSNGNGNGKPTESEDEPDTDGEEESTGAGSQAKATGGFTLEFDAARKIAQGLGVHLEQCTSLVEVKSDKARLLPVAERTAHLFGKGTETAAAGKGRKKANKQRSLFEELDEAGAAEAGWTEIKGPPPGSTVLDRVHQAMILFAANRGELLKRFLVEDGVGKDTRFWKLADNLNKLYPPGTEERRWVEGVLARKKGLGL